MKKRGSVPSDQPHEHDVQSKPPANWATRINRVLIAIGLIAFGVIVVDRLLYIYNKSESNGSVAQESAEIETQAAAQGSDVAGSVVQGDSTPIERNEALDPGTLFGAKTVFISMAEPKYLITEDDQRFDVGASINDQTVLTGISETQLILDTAGELTIIDVEELMSR
ncbi:MAG: hypothetical protein KTR32_23110 [Granulosicoccus sp.]|nr:hypothetical protein [Granulosicoccus sp.]